MLSPSAVTPELCKPVLDYMTPGDTLELFVAARGLLAHMEACLYGVNGNPSFGRPALDRALQELVVVTKEISAKAGLD